jgi:hypothetical protein
MANREAVRRVISPDFVGTYEADATDEAGLVRVRLGVRSEVRRIEVLDLTSVTKSEEGLREAVLQAANRAEAVRVLNELALAGGLDPDHPADPHAPLEPLPGPTAPRLVVRSPEEQIDHFQRYVNAGGLEPITAPGARWTTSGNGYLSLARNDRGQLTAITADQEWLWATNLDRLNNALTEAMEQ